MAKFSNKVIVLGVDGATLNVIRPLCEKGRLPGFAHLMKEGISGPLKSVVPTISAAAWTTFYTGMTPCKHGIHDFINKVPGEYQFKINSSLDRITKPIWAILGDAGNRVCVLGGTLTYPPDKVNGHMMAGIGSPTKKGYPLDTNYAFPESLDQEVTENVGRYRFGPILSPQFMSDKVRNAAVLKEEIIKTAEYRNRLYEYFLSKEEYDFCFFFYGETDIGSHLFWEDPEFIARVYETIDCFIVKLIAMDNVNIVLMSDHGFGDCNRLFNVDKWLETEGLINYRKMSIGQSLKKFINRFRIRLDRFTNIDWEHTQVFSSGSTAGSLFINLKGREKNGTVSQSEYDALCASLRRKLLNLFDPATGINPIDKVYFCKELFTGETSSSAPDLVFLLKEGYGIGLKSNRYIKHDDKEVFADSTYWSGDHLLEGVFMAYGEQFKKGLEVNGAEILDITPTLLYIFGLPVFREMEGRLLKEIFDDSFMLSNPVQLTNQDIREEKEDSELSAEETETMAEVLRNLGYLE